MSTDAYRYVSRGIESGNIVLLVLGKTDMPGTIQPPKRIQRDSSLFRKAIGEGTISAVMRRHALSWGWLLALAVVMVGAIIFATTSPKQAQPLWSTAFLRDVSKPDPMFVRLQAYGTDKLLGFGSGMPVTLFDFNGKVLWTTATKYLRGTPTWASLGGDGSIYVGTSEHAVYAFDPQQQLRWHFQADGTQTGCCSPTVALDGKVFVTDSEGGFYALDADGGELWQLPVDGIDGSQPPVLGRYGLIYAAANSGQCVAVMSDGVYEWCSQSDHFGRIPLMVSQDHVIAVDDRDGVIYAYESNGPIAWSYDTQTQGRPENCQVGADGTIYCLIEGNASSKPAATANSKLVALDPSGKLQWSVSSMNDKVFETFCLLPNNMLCAVEYNTRSLHAGIDSFLHHKKYSSISKYLMSLRGVQSDLRVFDANGKTVRTSSLSFIFTVVPPVVMPDGKVLLLGEDGKLRCYQP